MNVGRVCDVTLGMTIPQFLLRFLYQEFVALNDKNEFTAVLIVSKHRFLASDDGTLENSSRSKYSISLHNNFPRSTLLIDPFQLANGQKEVKNRLASKIKTAYVVL